MCATAPLQSQSPVFFYTSSKRVWAAIWAVEAAGIKRRGPEAYGAVYFHCRDETFLGTLCSISSTSICFHKTTAGSKKKIIPPRTR